jgi:hypothetical protein
MNTAVAPEANSRRTPGFAPHHPADAIFFPALLACLWLGLLAGFGPELVEHLTRQEAPYPWVVHVHAAIYVGWMILLTTQMTLIRRHQVAAHRRLGPLALAWAPAMVISGLAASYVVDQSNFGTTHWRPQFFAIQLGDVLDFAILVFFALRLRRDGAAHKRLMLLAVIALANAGFSRWWGPALRETFGREFGGRLLGWYLGDFILIAAVIGYDFITRRRVHPVTLAGGALIVAAELLAVTAYFDPGWTEFADRLLRP